MQFSLIETETDEKFLKQATDTLERSISQALSKTGRCVLGLSGGATPLPIYAELSNRALEWQNVFVFLVDERYVSPEHPDSNQRAIREVLLDKVGLQADHLIVPDTWKALPECVHLYDQALRDLLAKGPPDVITLGLGEDGHIASLFPPVSAEAFENAYAIATHTDAFAVPDRISTTMPVLLQAALPLFFLKSRTKKRVWTKMLKSPVDPVQWPAHALLALGRTEVIAEWPSPKKVEAA